jgi:hypothetical protein
MESNSKPHEDYRENNELDNEDESPSHLVEQTDNNMPCQTTLLMRAMTWNRESYGLFDYESKNLK